ncbi:hypothetical protein DYB32_005767 [Aphanomyces invadans]|uniref:Elicitin n=1 Tax=Aphanomyces invadans TaxID=157072 RepID=A0A3R6Z2W3_9STRA|nr:hypothetical protein DYB32_005767 [Aphanomyces invadans]
MHLSLVVALFVAALTGCAHAEMVETKPLTPCNDTEQELIEAALKDGLIAPPQCQDLWADATANFSSPVDKWDQISMNDTLFFQVCSIPECKSVLEPWALLPNCDALIDITSKEIANLHDMAIQTAALCEAVLSEYDEDAPSDASLPPKSTFFRTAPPPSTIAATLPITKRPTTPRPTLSGPYPTVTSRSSRSFPLSSAVVMLFIMVSLVCMSLQ